MSTLDRVIILNLERRIDRFHFILGSMKTLEFPGVWEAAHGNYDGLIMRYIAHDYKDYNSPDEIVEAAARDGFPELADHMEHLKKRYTAEMGWLGRFATLWSQAALFRYIADNNQNAIYLLDNHSFTCRYPYSRVLKVLRDATGRWSVPLLIIQLGFDVGNIPNYQNTTFVNDGLLLRWDQALYMTPRGAELLLGLITQKAQYSDGDMMARLDDFMSDSRANKEGCYHLLDPMIGLGWNFDSDREQEV